MTTIVQIIIFIVIISVGQILFKLAANSLDKDISISKVLFTPEIWIAFILYSSATFLWIHILTKNELSKTYPYVSLTFLVVPILSVFFLKEKLDLYYLLGAALILSGLFVMNRSIYVS